MEENLEEGQAEVKSPLESNNSKFLKVVGPD